MDDSTLATAFSMSNRCENGGLAFAEEFGADCASPGKFLRKGKFLNVPNPGASFGFSAAVSITITQEVYGAVNALLHWKQHAARVAA